MSDNCEINPCDVCVKRANAEPCQAGCLGFRVTGAGSLIPCDVCGIDDAEIEKRIRDLLRTHAPEKKDHPNTECGPNCRGWDVFDADREHLEIERSDECGVFDDDSQAVTAACKFFHDVTDLEKHDYSMLLVDDKDPNLTWCAKCGAPMFSADATHERCVECGDDRVMPCDAWPCDLCGKEIGGVVPALTYDNTLAEALGAVLCEVCAETLSVVSFDEAKREIETKWLLRVAEPPPKPDPEKMRAALRALIVTINATGGVYYENGRVTLAVDDEWFDLADVYESACAALGVEVDLVGDAEPAT